METSNQDGSQALIAPFKALGTNALQRRALEGLIQTLTSQQIRELRSAIDGIALHCDIIAELPLEISLIILQYLPLYQIFQARRVSSKWRQTLSSSQVVEPLLRDWFPKRDVDLRLQIPKGLPSESITSLKAEHIDAYRTGHAFSSARHQWDCLANPVHLDLVAYANGNLAWLEARDSHLVRIRDLKTGHEWSLLPEARTKLTAIAISPSMVIALGLGRCHVWTLPKTHEYCLRLPSARRANLAVAGESLAIVYEVERHRPNPHVDVITWTLKNQRASSFAVTLCSKDKGHAFPPKIMLDNTGESLILFQCVRQYLEHDKSMRFYYTRTSLDGKVLSQGSVKHPDSMAFCLISTDGVPKEVNGQAVIWAFHKGLQEGSRNFELMLICYDFQQDRLVVCKRVISDVSIEPDLEKIFDKSGLSFWKDAAYYLHYEYGVCHLRVINLRDSVCSEAKVDLPEHYGGWILPLPVPEEPEIRLFSDETFVITVFDSGFCVWCFDANVQMINEEIDFKNQRKDNIKLRLRLNF